MRNRFRIVPVVFAVLISLGAPRAGPADELRVPASVVAQIDGSFSFVAKFYKGPGSEELGGYSWSGEENIGGGIVADCFCIPGNCTLDPGDSLTLQVAGQLIDPANPGLARISVSLCSSPPHQAFTSVLPYGTTVVGDPAPAMRFWNAPNPVAPVTTFHWEIPEPGAVQLRIYDLAGRALATLVDEVQPAGRHQMDWNAGSAPGFRGGGVFFARLSVPGRISSRPIIVMRR